MAEQIKWYGDELLATINKATPGGLWAGAEVLLDGAKAKTPGGGTGTLKDSAYISSKERSTYRADSQHNREKKPDDDGVVAGFAAFYARYIELGTAKRSARPFLRPAIDELQGKIAETISNHIGKSLK